MLHRPILQASKQQPQQITIPKRVQTHRQSQLMSPIRSFIQHQSPSIISNSDSNYMMHLLPQQVQIVKSPPHRNPYAPSPQHSSTINFAYQNREDQLNQSNSIQKSALNINNHNMSSTATRSKDFSVLSNKKSQLQQMQRQEYFSPPSPTHLRKIEPIRRVSQHKVNISQMSDDKSSKIPSQQNINILIETNIPNDSDQPPPKITISHIQKAPIDHEKATILRNAEPIPPKQIIVNQPILVEQRYLPKETVIQKERSLSNDFKLIHLPPPRQNVPPPSFHHAPMVHPLIERKHSLSMDNRGIVRPMTNYQTNPTMTSSSGFKQQQFLAQQPSAISKPEQPISFNNQRNSQLLIQGKQSVKVQQMDRIKQSYLKQSKERQEKGSLEMQQQLQQQQNSLGKQIYNEYYEQGELQSSLSSVKRTKRQYAYFLDQRINSSSKMLINQIFQNQTNKALLKIRSVEKQSREKSLRRHKL